MKADQVEGVAQKIAGKAQGALGDMLDDEQLQAEGAGREAGGQLQQAYGDVVDNVSGFVKANPIGALAIAAGVSLLLGRLLARK